MFHVPHGALVVPYALPDLHRTVAALRLQPVVADDRAAVAARAKAGATTVCIGTATDVDAAVRSWTGPVVAVGGTVDGATLVLPAGARLGLLTANAAPADSEAVVVGDVHNCTRTLDALLAALEVEPGAPSGTDPLVVFVGDIVDKGGAPGDDPLGALRTVHTLVRAGQAVLVRGNHEQMLVRRFRGQSDTTPRSEQLLAATREASDGTELVRWLGTTPLAFKLAPVASTPVTVGHATATTAAFIAGAKARHAAEQACLFGRKTGQVVNGIVVHGHVEVDAVTVVDAGATRFVNVDTGACLGNKLSAVRFTADTDEVATVSVATVPGDLGQ